MGMNDKTGQKCSLAECGSWGPKECTSSDRGVSGASLLASESEGWLVSSAAAGTEAILGAVKFLLAASHPGKRLKYCAMPIAWTGIAFFMAAQELQRVREAS